MHFDLSEPRAIGSLTFGSGPLAFGCWRFSDPDTHTAARLIETALDHGLTLVDTADIYGLAHDGAGFGRNEEILGQMLAASPGLRSRMILATKGGIVPGVPYDSSARHLIEACEASLRRLKTDVIDLYQIHRPDMFAHPAEVAQALDRLVTSGKIREYGVSNYTPAQHEALAAHCHRRIATTQPEFSAAHLHPLRDGTLDLAMRLGVCPLAWSPLAGGRIPKGVDLPGPLLATLDALAAREGTTRANVALAFVLAHPSRPLAILGTQRPDRIIESLGALDVRLSRQDVYEIVEASEGLPLP
jgi:predicted oxidoreductase